VRILEDAEPGFNLRPHKAHFSSGDDSVEWELWSKVVGQVSYSISANGFTRAGTF
jgi:hypothetical protein